MINIKLLPIDDCDDCLYIYYDKKEPFCVMEEKYIERSGEAIPIPEWCTLKEV